MRVNSCSLGITQEYPTSNTLTRRVRQMPTNGQPLIPPQSLAALFCIRAPLAVSPLTLNRSFLFGTNPLKGEGVEYKSEKPRWIPDNNRRE